MNKSADLEIELTYLARQIPVDIVSAAGQELVDIYVPEDVDFPQLRIRKKDNQYEITKKSPLKHGDLSAHYEETILLNEAEYQVLSQVSSRKLEKRRFSSSAGSYTIELDIFHGDLTGLVLIDFEFKTMDDKAAFTPPAFCLLDVTQEKLILGSHLAGKSYADIEPMLEEFGYKPLYLTN
jgi:adenylate cyclase